MLQVRHHCLRSGSDNGPCANGVVPDDSLGVANCLIQLRHLTAQGGSKQLLGDRESRTSVKPESSNTQHVASASQILGS